MIDYLKQYITFGKFEIDEVLPFINNDKRDRKIYEVNGVQFKVRMDSVRYKVFAKSLSCTSCNIAGKFFLLQKFKYDLNSKDTAHFNLYAENKCDLNIILMTKDHILPKSKGGKDTLSNLVTMCSKCNNKKSNSLVNEK